MNLWRHLVEGMNQRCVCIEQTAWQRTNFEWHLQALWYKQPVRRTRHLFPFSYKGIHFTLTRWFSKPETQQIYSRWTESESYVLMKGTDTGPERCICPFSWSTVGRMLIRNALSGRWLSKRHSYYNYTKTSLNISAAGLLDGSDVPAL